MKVFVVNVVCHEYTNDSGSEAVCSTLDKAVDIIMKELKETTEFYAKYVNEESTVTIRLHADTPPFQICSWEAKAALYQQGEIRDAFGDLWEIREMDVDAPIHATKTIFKAHYYREIPLTHIYSHPNYY